MEKLKEECFVFNDFDEHEVDAFFDEHEDAIQGPRFTAGTIRT